MTSLSIAVLFLLGVLVLAESLNKLERTAPCAKGITSRQRLLAWLKAIAWVQLAFAGGGAVVGSFFGEAPPTLRELCLFGGFSTLIIRTRFKEG